MVCNPDVYFCYATHVVPGIGLHSTRSTSSFQHVVEEVTKGLIFQRRSRGRLVLQKKYTQSYKQPSVSSTQGLTTPKSSSRMSPYNIWSLDDIFTAARDHTK